MSSCTRRPGRARSPGWYRFSNQPHCFVGSTRVGLHARNQRGIREVRVTSDAAPPNAKGRQAIDHTGLDGLNVHTEYHVATPSHDLSISEAPLPGGGLMASNEVPQVELAPRPERNWGIVYWRQVQEVSTAKTVRRDSPNPEQVLQPASHPATSTSSTYLTVGGPKPPTGAPGVQNQSWDRPAVALYRTVGGARGIGRAIAARLISAGARVVIGDVDADADGVPRARRPSERTSCRPTSATPRPSIACSRGSLCASAIAYSGEQRRDRRCRASRAA
jgi:hypothetical protein